MHVLTGASCYERDVLCHVDSAVALIWLTFDLDVISFHGLLDCNEEDHVNEDYAVSCDQIEHLEALCVTNVLTFGLIIHLLDQDVPPQVQCQHRGEDDETADHPQGECNFPALHPEEGEDQSLEGVEEDVCKN